MDASHKAHRVSADIKESVKNATEDFLEWCEASKREADRLKRDQRKFHVESQDRIADLEAEQIILAEKSAQIDEELSEGQKMVRELEGDIESFHLKENSLPQRLELEQAKLDKRRHTIRSQQRRLKEEERKRTHEQKHLANGVEFYRERLGMELLTTVSGLKVVFTKLSTSQPDVEFSFTLKVDEDDIYHMEGCEPHVKYEDLLKDLNKSMRLDRFAVGMRRRFKELAK